MLSGSHRIVMRTTGDGGNDMALAEDPRDHIRRRPLGQSALCLGTVIAGLVAIALVLNIVAGLLM